MCFLLLPKELQELVISHIDDVETLLILNISCEEVKFVSIFQMHNYLMKNTLKKLFGKLLGDFCKLRNSIQLWKNNVFDRIPLGDRRRKIIAHAFYFLSGQYNIFFHGIFEHHIQDKYYYNDFSLGKLYNEKLFYTISPKIINLNKLRSSLNADNSPYKEKLFEELVGILNFRIKTLSKLSMYEKQHYNAYKPINRKKCHHKSLIH